MRFTRCRCIGLHLTCKLLQYHLKRAIFQQNDGIYITFFAMLRLQVLALTRRTYMNLPKTR